MGDWGRDASSSSARQGGPGFPLARGCGQLLRGQLLPGGKQLQRGGGTEQAEVWPQGRAAEVRPCSPPPVPRHEDRVAEAGLMPGTGKGQGEKSKVTPKSLSGGTSLERRGPERLEIWIVAASCGIHGDKRDGMGEGVYSKVAAQGWAEGHLRGGSGTSRAFGEGAERLQRKKRSKPGALTQPLRCATSQRKQRAQHLRLPVPRSGDRSTSHAGREP